MSSQPTGWQTPRTNWKSADVPLPTDFNRIEGNMQAIESGSRTLDPSQVPSGNQGTLRQMLDWFANRIRAITGTTNWYDAPPYTLAGATPSATANQLVARDANGRAKFADPSSAQDAATKGYVDGLVGSLQAGTAFAYYLLPPNVSRNTLSSDYADWWVQNEGGSLVVRILLPGTIRYHVQHRSNHSSQTSYVRILRNGSQIREVSTSSTSWQTVTGNINVSPGDIVTIQQRISSGGTTYWQNVRIETAQPPLGIQRF